MPGVVSIIKPRMSRRSSERRSPARSAGFGCASLISLLLALGGILLALQYSQATQNLPPIDILPALLEPPNGQLLEPTRVYDRSGEHLLLELQHPAGKREYFSLPATGTSGQAVFSENLIQATLAAVDPDFYTHPGTTLSKILPGGRKSIAQRLVSELLLADEPPSVRRQIREAILALQITEQFGRDQVLEWYLNSADYGRLAFGAGAASRLYFDRSAADLDLAEAALLAGTALEPLQNPLDMPQAALARQKQILLDLLESGWVEPAAAAGAARQTVQVRPTGQPGRPPTVAELVGSDPPIADPAFLQLALEQIQIQIPRKRLERGGLKIFTTLDYELQQQLTCLAQAQLDRLRRDSQAETFAAGCEAARLLPALQPGESLADLGAQVVVLDPQTGQVLALTAASAGTNRAALGLTDHPIGELGVPLIYLTAFTRGLAPASPVWDIPATGDLPALTQNTDRVYHGPVRMRIALVNDYAAPADRLLEQVGLENVWRTAQQLGLTAPPSLEINPSGSNLTANTIFRPLDALEVAQTYGVLANGGLLAGQVTSSLAEGVRPADGATVAIQTAAALRVEDIAGRIWLDWSAWQTRPILTEPLAYLMTHVLSDEPARWPSLGHPNPLEIGRPAAAKLGRSPTGEGAWAMGYSRERVAAVWLGVEGAADSAADSNSQMSDAASGLYHAVMKTALRDLPVIDRPAPEGVSFIRVCDPSGMLPTAICPNVVDEIFLAGTEPLQTDRLYYAVPINRQNGRLATIFTPPDLVEERPYLIPPPEAAEWARQSGLETPPESYDTLAVDPAAVPETQITSPKMLEVVRGQVPILGTAGGERFSFYRLQVGAGLNPPGWRQIGVDEAKKIEAGLLGTWDTTGLKDGIFALELLVVGANDRVQRAAVLVSVDNTAPQIEIISPVQLEQVALSERPDLVLLAQVHDNLGTGPVEFFLDGRSLANFSQPPYAIYWSATLGEHHLKVSAADQAGNPAQAEITFTVVP